MKERERRERERCKLIYHSPAHRVVEDLNCDKLSGAIWCRNFVGMRSVHVMFGLFERVIGVRHSRKCVKALSVVLASSLLLQFFLEIFEDENEEDSSINTRFI